MLLQDKLRLRRKNNHAIIKNKQYWEFNMGTETTNTINMGFLVNFAKGLAKLMGQETEIVLHDLKQKKIIYIENGYITGRTVESPEDLGLIQTIISLADADGHLVGFGSTSKLGKPLRTSHFIFRDNAGVPIALICINQDMSAIHQLRDQLNRLLDTRSFEDTIADEGENYIQTITKHTIFREVEQVKPNGLASKEVKLRVIDALDQKGVFDVKDSVTLICEQLSISQATLYNYLREVRQSR